MRPDQRWFPTSRTERAAWFQNFAVKFTVIAASLGFTQADIDSVNADNAIVQYLNRTLLATENYTKAVVSFQRTILLGKRGATTPDFPALNGPLVPTVPATGVFERLERMVRRIRVATNYTPEVGGLLGIIPRNAGRPDMLSVKPTFKVSAAARPFSFEIRVVKRTFKVFCVYVQRQSSKEWEMAATLTRTPVVLDVIALTPNMPEVIRVRVRMWEGNEPVGQFSDVRVITLSP